MKKRAFIDLDDTLYDSNRMFDPIRADMIALGHPPEEVDRHAITLSAEGYSFERHLRALGHPPAFVEEKKKGYYAVLARGDHFLFPGIARDLRTLACVSDCHLLTYGDPAFQMHKATHIPSLQRSFTRMHYVWRQQTKGEVIRSMGRHMAVWFLDNEPNHLLDAREKAPWAQPVRMCWPETHQRPHEGDGTLWPVVSSFSEFVQLVEVA